jgi:ubiquinone/menaquinone biosynthesis C-methylase UbiE
VSQEAHDRRFHGEPDRLRSPERLRLLEVGRVVSLCLEGEKVSTVLDVGTGTGVFAEAFANEGLTVRAIDANPGLLDLARQFAPSAEFKQGRAEAIPYPDGSVDLVFLGHVLHETDDGVKALGEACRVSAGKVAVLEWPFIEEDQGPPLDHRLSPERVQSMARQAGLAPVRHMRLEHMDLYLMEA